MSPLTLRHKLRPPRSVFFPPAKTRLRGRPCRHELRHRLFVGISRNMPLGTPLMLRSLRHLPPLPHDCPAPSYPLHVKRRRKARGSKRLATAELRNPRQRMEEECGFLQPKRMHAKSQTLPDLPRRLEPPRQRAARGAVRRLKR